MKIRIHVTSRIDRRTADLIARGDSITERLYAWRVRRNHKERARLERASRTEQLPALLRPQAG